MKTIHHSANNVLPNGTGLVGVQVLDIDQAQPSVSLVPILGWAMAEGVRPQPVCLWSAPRFIDGVYDPRTGHVTDETGGSWSSLDAAVEHFVTMHRLRRSLEQTPAPEGQ